MSAEKITRKKTVRKKPTGAKPPSAPKARSPGQAVSPAPVAVSETGPEVMIFIPNAVPISFASFTEAYNYMLTHHLKSEYVAVSGHGLQTVRFVL